MKRILGLDLGTNSIGWALLEIEEEKNKGQILGVGSRIIPMSQDILGKFDSGQSISQTAERTRLRSIRRLRERFLLRRERLHRVLNILGFLPSHYAAEIDFDRRLGQFFPDREPKLAYDNADFIFKASFNEMLQEFTFADGKKIPYDWTIYYLRKKALTQRIEKEEIAWLLLNFNQKRGYNQLRGEDAEETPSKKEEFYSLQVTEVIATGEKKSNDDIWYNVVLENGWIYRRTSKTPLDWVGKVKEFIVTTELNEDGTIKVDKEGKEKRSFRAPAENDWALLKKKTEHDIDKSGKTVGAYIYDSLSDNPSQKIKGKLVRVVERKFYKAELETILKKQREFHPELRDDKLYNHCLQELYQHNDAHKRNIAQKGFVHLFVNDIIFYQRPLKSKKSLISNCKFERKRFMKEGRPEFIALKCIAKSHPLFQEFRLWEFVQNLRIYQNEKEVNSKLLVDVDVTAEFFKSEDDWVRLFEWLNERKDIEQKVLFKQYLKIRQVDNYRWNYVVDKSYPCNETRAQMAVRLNKVENVPAGFLNKENEESLWHILYSVIEKNEIIKALRTFAIKKGLGNDFVEVFQKFPAYEKEYGAYSAKAIKKLLPLMRRGKYWDQNNIDESTKQRIDKIITGEYDEAIRDRVRDKAISLSDITDFKGLPHWLASYIVYDRHAEDGDRVMWRTAADITILQQYSLRNPIVEQVINESLLVVRDIWNHYGKGEDGFFDEIHIELGREMKNPADRRKKMMEKMNENENTNLRIKALLVELMNDSDVENVRPYSPMQQEILKIYEEGVLNAEATIPDDILKIIKQAQPGKAELIRYKLWLQQKYRSPYTGMIIPLNKLFTSAYEIEHIIPQSRYFDDSFSNKVICESEINKDKDNRTAYEYIKSNGGKKVALSFGKDVTLLSIQDYEALVKDSFGRNRSKMTKLLMEDIPEAFIQRQLNDSRYISKVVKDLMSRIVREDDEQESISRRVVASNGNITATLRNDWGLNDIWNEIITPRFERMNELTKSKNFGEWTNKEGKRVFQTQIPLELSKGFSKKRIDHRHHALDAIVVACSSRNHVNYLNNESAIGKGKEGKRYDLKQTLCSKKYNNGSGENYKWIFNKPWDSFTQDVREALLNTVVSFKQNLRVLNKKKNYYQAWRSNGDGKMEKQIVPQLKGENWAIRKPLHKDTVSGIVRLKVKKVVSLSLALNDYKMIVDKGLRKQIEGLIGQGKDKKEILQFFKGKEDVSKVEIYLWNNENAAARVSVNEYFNSVNIESITDTGIRRIMLSHLKEFNEIKEGKTIEHPELAFSSDGLDILNANITQLNGGKLRKPIYKVRTFEPKGNKFVVGEKGNKGKKYVEAAKGTNLFFAIYVDESGKRSYETIPLNIVIERKKQGLQPVPERNDNGLRLLFHLSPNDLVYVPSEEEMESEAMVGINRFGNKDINRIYKVVSFTTSQIFFIRNNIASPIWNKVEFSANNKLERSIEGIMIKDVCVKLKVDRLGNLTYVL